MCASAAAIARPRPRAVRLTCFRRRRRRVALFPNWVVRYVRAPNIKMKQWMGVPVEVFLVSPKMTKFEIKEYLTKLYELPVMKVHTANYAGRWRMHANRVRYKLPDFKKAYVYLRPESGSGKGLRYEPISAQQTPEARAAWPARPSQHHGELNEAYPAYRPSDARR